jgi:2'-5' RNA ligase
VNNLALWLVPPTTRRAEYATFIDALSERFGGPRFVPHVTLLTGVEACDEGQLRALAESCRGLTITPVRLASFDEYYRTLVVEVELTEALRRARDAAIGTFGGSAGGYEPHLSLMYGELPEEKRTEALRALAGTAFPSFVPEVLEAVEITGPPDRWHSPVQIMM